MDSAFWVNEISEKYFYKFVIKKHIKEINANISGNNDADGSKNIDFIKYLDDNYKLIFEEEKDSDQFASITLVAEDCYDINKSQSSVYAFDDELKTSLIRSGSLQESLICAPANMVTRRLYLLSRLKNMILRTFSVR